jgi:hypothetical protein
MLALAAGCTNQQLQGNSSSYLIIDSLLGASGAKPAEFGGTLSSDVLTMVKVTIDGKETQVPTIFSDLAKVKFELALKNPGGSGDSAAKPSTTNFVTLTRYQVAFSRTDGRNTPGVDVPYGFDGAMTVTVGAAGGEGDFTIVRIQAKQESPLKALANGGGAYTISTIAEVTFFGTDQAGRHVNVTGRISVNFADWGDPQ